MTERERQLIGIIRAGKDPAELFRLAVEAITACLTPPAPCGSPCPAAPASAGETDQ